MDAKQSGLPGNFARIRLTLAREPGHPEGSRDIGYDLVVPLTGEGRIDAELWRDHRDRYRFLRFCADRDDKAGHLVHRPGGSWAFHYDVQGNEEDARGFHFQDERFVVGEYVSIREISGMHTYVVSSVAKL